ncbi:signal recognition particle, SRP9/SRP14 subunit [Truncatella angustata]|uniref:Signal recognition particle subunit SRP14 n=1 Tax=Truncatella angustata TaxID=152316 RepID=A0A9P8ZX46_9PEZI|nr:signal recognition particle, SRP9/SRP14 subunit [Truncatella angustata]KAH6653718.1 signal recognition particle, SRP9/SRP14 subunit [Truncatella angustata]
MGHSSNDEFFVKLQELFDSRKGKDHGMIYLTQKRLSYDQDLPEATIDNPLPDLHPAKPLPILIRATNGKSKEKRKEKLKVKLSTVVEADALPVFFEKYAEVCKAGMATLKPRDRSKRKGKAKKRKTVAPPAGTS